MFKIILILNRFSAPDYGAVVVLFLYAYYMKKNAWISIFFYLKISLSFNPIFLQSFWSTLVTEFLTL